MDNFRHSSEVKTNERTNNKQDNPKKVIRIGLDSELLNRLKNCDLKIVTTFSQSQKSQFFNSFLIGQ